MTLRLASFSFIALTTTLALGACNPIIVAHGNTGGAGAESGTGGHQSSCNGGEGGYQPGTGGQGGYQPGVGGTGGMGGYSGVGGTGGAGGGCIYEGQSYPVGASFPAGDNCNTCTCDQSGTVSCTTNPCPFDGGPPACSDDAQCGCGCFCLNGACECTGAIPPTCNTDADCGPACLGLHCVAHQCK